MIILAHLLGGIAVVLDFVLSAMLFFVFIAALISWVSPDPFNPIVRFLTSRTEPLFKPIRRYIPLLGGRVDLSPLVAILLILFLQQVLVGPIRDYAQIIRGQALRDSLGLLIY